MKIKSAKKVYIDMQEDGHIIIKTKLEMLPVSVAQEVLDNTLAFMIQHLQERGKNDIKNLRIQKYGWLLVAILSIILNILLYIKMKGL